MLLNYITMHGTKNIELNFVRRIVNDLFLNLHCI